MDYYIEDKLNRDDPYARRLKGRKFDERMTRLREAQLLAERENNEREYNRLKSLERYTLDKINKYRGLHLNS